MTAESLDQDISNSKIQTFIEQQMKCTYTCVHASVCLYSLQVNLTYHFQAYPVSEVS